MCPTIQEVKDKYKVRLLALPSVVSVGIGRGKDNKLAIIVGLDRHRPETMAQIPRFLEDYPVSIQIIGPVTALQNIGE